MLAVDTNVVIRYLTRDDARQFARASALIRTEDVFVCTTVLLECEWVLRWAYQHPRERIVDALRSLAGLPSVTLEDAALAVQALDWLAGGMDFADALRLAKAGGCEALVSFDRQLANAAKRIGGLRVRAP
jgi:predicted nucleic-acid-binding protein